MNYWDIRQGMKMCLLSRFSFSYLENYLENTGRWLERYEKTPKKPQPTVEKVVATKVGRTAVVFFPWGQIMIYVPHGRSLSMRLMKKNPISAWIPFHFSFLPENHLGVVG